uniref:Uncharacterized protein n=1 Tax=Timema cristinae TaxID=61476 RepID=A0A7R9GQM1_TIMCR|nr:unnamed protein product [Timema cristinae]
MFAAACSSWRATTISRIKPRALSSEDTHYRLSYHVRLLYNTSGVNVHSTNEPPIYRDTDFIRADPDPLPMFGFKKNGFIKVSNFSYQSCSPDGKLTLSNLNLQTNQGVLTLSGQASATSVLAPPIKVLNMHFLNRLVIGTQYFL